MNPPVAGMRSSHEGWWDDSLELRSESVVGEGEGVVANLSTRQAAEFMGISPAGFRSFASRSAAAGNPLTVPEQEWPDRRSPQYDEQRLKAALATRPGKGRRPRKGECRDAPYIAHRSAS